jgi:hypothetical protein
VQQHLLLLLHLSDQERGTCNICVVQQYYVFQIDLCLQVKEILISFNVHQHSCPKIELCHEEKATLVVFCVQQHQFPKILPFS